MLNPVQFRPARTITAGEIALLTGARLMNPASESLVVRNLAPADRCNDGDLTYVDGKAGRSAESALKASAVLCRTDVADAFSGDLAVLATESPRRHFAQVARLLFPDAVRPAAITGEYGISQQAHVHADTELEADVTIESGAVVGQDVAIGSGTIIAPNAVLGNGCRIGRNCYIGPGCSIVSSLIGDRVIIHAGARIGFDGFGYVPGRNGIEKVPQIGRVIIQDDVEIGTNVTIDRGALSDTVIGESTKIDNLVQVAHNVRIGRGCLIAAQSGLAGSCELGDYVMLGGQVGISDHIVIGKGAQIGAMSGVGSNVGAGQRWLGYPARPAADALRLHARLARLLRKNGKAGKQDV